MKRAIAIRCLSFPENTNPSFYEDRGRFLVLLIIPLVLLQLYIYSYRISTSILKKQTSHGTVSGG